MKQQTNHNKYLSLRRRYPVFTYQSYSFHLTNQTLKAEFVFNISDEFTFRPGFSIPMRSFMDFENMDDAALHSLVFHIGMVELISYWKATCSPDVRILPHKLSKVQEAWWKKLYFNGLGEFFYVNGIEAEFDDFMRISSSGMPVEPLELSLEKKDILVPVGGGKDSIVTLEVLRKEGNQLIPVMLNPREASLRTIEIAGFRIEDCAVVNRSLDKLLLDLNDRGFLNGHTPFSALLAFVNILLASACGTPFIALSNESSASESTIPGTEINHQYSKSYEFEQDFNSYVRNFLHPGLRYFSFLRPVNELQIARIFSGYPEHFHSFRSCNVGSKTDSWCGKCPKCLFTFIMLSPFVNRQVLTGIFSKDLYLDESLTPVFDELSGIAEVKPFECVGTPDEVKAALWKFAETHSREEWPPLISYFKDHFSHSFRDDLNQLLAQFEKDHFIPGFLEKTIQSTVDGPTGLGFVKYLSKRLENKKILILGFGKEGKSTFRYLSENFPDVSPDVADANPDIGKSELLLQVDDHRLHLGEHYLDDIGAYDIVIKSPGVKLDMDALPPSVEWSSQTELVMAYFKQRMIGVTGTKGKSTTASLIFHMLSANNLPAVLFGNIGVPAFDMIPIITRETVIVYELSAHQLEFLHTSPHVSVLLNVFPEHLDYFGDVDHYMRAKKQIFMHQEKQDFLVIHEAFKELTGDAVSTVITFGEGEAAVGQLSEEAIYFRDHDSRIARENIHTQLKGKHNLLNVVAAVLAVEKFGVRPDEAVATLSSFKPLPHRLEYVGNYGGIHFYNDSISTVPESTIAALDTLDEVDTLILGGYDRRLDYNLLINRIVNSNINNLIFLGKAGVSMMTLLKNRCEDSGNAVLVKDLEEAVSEAFQRTGRDRICLLSPAAASYDQFHNFEHRGDTFRELVKTKQNQ